MVFPSHTPPAHDRVIGMIQRKEYVWQGARSIDTAQEEVCARMDAKIPLAGSASGGTRQSGAECRCGVHACPPSRGRERTERSRAGPPRLYDKAPSPRLRGELPQRAVLTT